MSSRFPLPRIIWVFCIIAAGAFVWWTNVVRIQHEDFVTNATETGVVSDLQSPTGYADGLRQAVMGGNDAESREWIAQTQQAIAQRTVRLRHIDYDNAPYGRDVSTSSLYRWWLQLVAKLHQLFSKGPIGQSVERAGFLADPALYVFILALSFFVARRLGLLAGGILAIGAAALFPLAGNFAAGEPQDRGLEIIFALASIIPLLVPSSTDLSSRRVAFFLAGLAGGISLWIRVSDSWLVLGGIILGAVVMAVLIRRKADEAPLPWRAWAIGGALASLTAFIAESFPAHWAEARLDIVNPLYIGLWLVTGEWLARVDSGFGYTAGASTWKRRGLIPLTLLTVAVSVPCILAFVRHHGPTAVDLFGARLSALGGGSGGTNLFSWIFHQDLLPALATLGPLLVIPLAIWVFIDNTVDPRKKRLLSLAIGPVLFIGFVAFSHLRQWSLLETSLLCLLIAAMEAARSSAKAKLHLSLQLGVGAFAILCGGATVTPPLGRVALETVSRAEVQTLVERDLAEWLTTQAGPDGAIVLAPPDLSGALSYYGKIRAVCTPNLDDQSGLAAALRIAFASSQDEAREIILRRKVSYIVLASWDSFFEDQAQRSGIKTEATLLGLLKGWRAPRWLRPMPYPVPQIPGFEGQTVSVFQVVDLQDNAVALSHLADYFVEMGQLDAAAAVSQALEKFFPDDLGAAISRVEIETARGRVQTGEGAAVIVKARLAEGAAASLPWDRQVALAIILAEGKDYAAAKTQAESCLGELDEDHLKTLTPVSLYRFQTLIKGFGLTESPELREAALKRLPPQMRQSL